MYISFHRHLRSRVSAAARVLRGRGMLDVLGVQNSCPVSLLASHPFYYMLAPPLHRTMPQTVLDTSNLSPVQGSLCSFLLVAPFGGILLHQLPLIVTPAKDNFSVSFGFCNASTLELQKYICGNIKQVKRWNQ